MSVVTDLGLRQLTVQQLDQIAVEQFGVVGILEQKDGLKKDETICSLTLPGGWMAMWTGGQTKPTQGKLLLKGITPRTFGLLKKGTIKRWVGMGLTDTQANKLWTLRCDRKFELAKAAGLILNDVEQLAVWLSHPREYGRGTKRQVWFASAKSHLSQIHPAPFETELAQVLYTLVN